MLRPVDQYFAGQAEPSKSCLLFLRNFILLQHENISETWKYGMPFYCFDGKRFCYLWVHKKLLQPYIGIVEGRKMDHPDLLQEKRTRMKILLVDPEMDIPLAKIEAILKAAIRHTGK